MTTAASLGAPAVSNESLDLQAIVNTALTGLLTTESQLEHFIPRDRVSRQDLEEMYATGHAFYQARQYMKALPVLVDLLARTPAFAASHLAVAACTHRLGRFHEAAQTYLVAYALNVADPLPLFHCADCMSKLQQPSEAIMVLREFIRAADPETHAVELAQARAALNALSSTLD